MEKQKCKSTKTEQKNRKNSLIKRGNDLQNRRFSHLTVMEPLPERDHRGCVIWKCLCDCGNVVEVQGSKLRSGAIGSCGCRRSDINSRTFRSAMTYVDGTCVEILKKRKCRRDNKSGFRGVFQVENGSYRVSIGFQHKRYYLGYYSSLNEAIRIRLQAEELIHEGFLDAYQSWEDFAAEHERWAEVNPFSYKMGAETPELLQNLREKKVCIAAM